MKNRKGMYLADSLVLTIENIRTLNLLKVQIVGDLSLQQHGDKVTTSHQELGNQINIIISILAKSSKLFRSRLTISKLLVKILKQ